MNEICAAILTITDPSTTNDARTASQAFLDQVLTRPNLDVLALELISNINPQIQYYGFLLLETLLRRPITESLKNAVIQVINIVGDSMDSCPVYIQKKACWIFAELARRIWPLEWTDMDLMLIQLFDNIKTRPLSLYILNSLMEDIFIYGDEIAAKRKTALITALTAITLDGSLLSELQDFQDGRVDVQLLLDVCRLHQDNPGWLKTIVASLGNCDTNTLIKSLECLKLFLFWIPFKAVMANNMVGLLTELLKQPNCITIGLEMWLVLLDRNYPANAVEYRDLIIWKPWLEQQNLELLYNLWQAQFKNTDTKTTKKIAEVAGALSKHIAFKRNSSFAPTRLPDLIEFYKDIGRHPSPSVAGNGVQAILDLVRNEFIGNVMIEKIDVQRLLEDMLGNLNVRTDQVALDIYYLEYDTVSEGKARARSNIVLRLDIIKSITKLMPASTFLWISAIISKFFSNEDTGFDLDQLSSAFGAIMSSIPTALFSSNENLVSKTGYLINGILQLDIREAKLVVHQLSIIGSFSKILKYYDTLVLPCLQKLLSFAVFTEPRENEFVQREISLSDSTQLVRHKAASAMLKMGNNLPEILIQVIDQMIPAIIALDQSKQVYKRESRIYKEFLIAVVFGVDIPVERKQALLDVIIGEDFLELQTLKMHLANANSFLDYIGLHDLSNDCILNLQDEILSLQREMTAETRFKYDQLDKNRRKLTGVLASFWSWLRKSIDTSASKNIPETVNITWKKYFTVLVEFDVNFIQCLHSIWNPATWEPLDSQLKIILGMTPSEKAVLMQTEFSEATAEEVESKSKVRGTVIKIWGWLARSREACYHFLATACQLELFYTQGLAGVVSTFIFSNGEFMSTDHWRVLLNYFVTPFIVKCPANYHSDLLGQFLKPMSSFLLARLQTEWQQAPSLNNLEELIFDSAQVTDEVISEFVLRGFTRSFANMWEAIFSDEKLKQGAEVIRKLRYPELALFCVSRMDLVDEWSKDIICLLQIKDTVACRSALIVSNAIIRELKGISEAFQFLGSKLLTALVNVVKDGYQKTNHHNALVQIAEIFAAISPHSNAPIEALLQQGLLISSIKLYEEKLKLCTTPKAMQELTLALLNDIAGSEVSTWGNLDQKIAADAREITMIRKQRLPDRKNILNDQNQENNIISDLFE